MKKIDVSLSDNRPFEETALAIGFFDGLHRGHKLLLDKVLTYPYKKAVLTFSRDFKSGLKNKRPELLLTEEERDAQLSSLGFDYLYILPFDEKTMSATPEAFLTFLKNLKAKAVVVGDDFSFGHKASGKAKDLLSLDKEGIRVDILSLLLENGEKVSSSGIKKHLKEKELVLAKEELGYPYFLEGKVIHGLENGRKIGFPTANIELPKEKLRLPDGVYKTRTEVEGITYPSMTNIGSHPTIEPLSRDIAETYIIGYEGNLYGKEIKVSFLDYLRDQKKFPSFEKLKEQLLIDIEKCRN